MFKNYLEFDPIISSSLNPHQYPTQSQSLIVSKIVIIIYKKFSYK